MKNSTASVLTKNSLAADSLTASSVLYALVSPKSQWGSFIYSVLLHGSMIAAVAIILNRSVETVVQKAEEFVDLGYQTFDEPPPPEKVIHRVQKTVETEQPVDSKIKPDLSPHELQDAKGDVVGTQKAAPQAAQAGSDTGGEAISTPYYKIKPKYPKAALIAGTEGWVLLKIDIAESGDVQNVRTVGGEQRNLFQSEAERAVSKWKYRPFIDSAGKALKKVDYQVRVDFKLADIGGDGT